MSIEIISGKRGFHLKVNGLYINHGFDLNIKAIKCDFGVPYGATEWVSICGIRKFWSKYMKLAVASCKTPHRSVWGQLEFIPINN